MKLSEIRTRLAARHAVSGIDAEVKQIRTGSLAGGWQYRKHRPTFASKKGEWMFAGHTEELSAQFEVEKAMES